VTHHHGTDQHRMTNNVTSHVVKNTSTAYDVSSTTLYVCRALMENHGQERGTICKIWYDQIPIQKFSKTNVKQNGVIYTLDFENQGAKAYPKSISPSGKVPCGTSATTTTLSTATTYALMSQESVMLGKPYVQKPDSGNNDYMRSTSLQQQHIF
jgi:hypothetical protein